MLLRLKRLFGEAGIEFWRALSKHKLITRRDGEEESEIVHCTIFLPFFSQGRKYLGRGTFDFLPTTTDKELLDLIEREKHEALTVFDPWFPLVNPQSLTTQKQVSSLSKMAPTEMLQTFHETTASIFRDFGIDPDLVQFQIKKTETFYWDNFDRELVNISYVSDAVFPLLPGRRQRFCEYLPQSLGNTLKMWAQEYDDVRVATEYKGKDLPILFSGRMVKEVFSYLLRQCSGLALYSGQSSLEIGNLIWDRPPVKDRISMKVISNLYNSPYTRFFDDQGKVLGNIDILTDNIFKTALTTQETAHYLGLPWTGHLTNFSIAPGTLDLARFETEPCLEIVSGNLIVDDKSGEFQLESDLAYHFEGSKKVPIKDLVLKGNLKHLLTDIQLSKEILLSENYEGPEYMLIPNGFMQGK